MRPHCNRWIGRIAAAMLVSACTATGWDQSQPAAIAAAPAPLRKLEVELITAPDGLPICVAETGNPQGPPILLIHGFSQTYAVFKRQFESDLARDFRLVAMDVRGHGCTGKPLTADAYLDSKLWADDIAAVIAAKKLVRPVLVGWSAGGYWIADYVRHYGTDNVAGSVLAGSHGGMLPRPTDAASVERMRAMVAANARFSPDVEQAIAGGDAFVNIMGAAPLPEDIRRIMHAGTLMLPAYARRAMSGRDMQHEDVIAKFRTPVLFIVGDQDRIGPIDQLQGLAKQFASARVSVFEQTGHSTFAERPERFNAELREFVLSVQGAARR
jgi:pimeloyl-ACP methyl ester carboxylesterase